MESSFEAFVSARGFASPRGRFGLSRNQQMLEHHIEEYFRYLSQSFSHIPTVPGYQASIPIVDSKSEECITVSDGVMSVVKYTAGFARTNDQLDHIFDRVLSSYERSVVWSQGRARSDSVDSLWTYGAIWDWSLRFFDALDAFLSSEVFTQVWRRNRERFLEAGGKVYEEISRIDTRFD